MRMAQEKTTIVAQGMISSSRRIGTFLIDALALDANHHGYRKTFELCSFLPISIELQGMTMLYTGLSPLFEIVEAGAGVPIYEFSMDENNIAALTKVN